MKPECQREIEETQRRIPHGRAKVPPSSPRSRRLLYGMGSFSYLSQETKTKDQKAVLPAVIAPGVPTSFQKFRENIVNLLATTNTTTIDMFPADHSFWANCILAWGYTAHMERMGYAGWYVDRDPWTKEGHRLNPQGWKGAQIRRFMQNQPDGKLTDYGDSRVQALLVNKRG